KHVVDNVLFASCTGCSHARLAQAQRERATPLTCRQLSCPRNRERTDCRCSWVVRQLQEASYPCQPLGKSTAHNPEQGEGVYKPQTQLRFRVFGAPLQRDQAVVVLALQQRLPNRACRSSDT